MYVLIFLACVISTRAWTATPANVLEKYFDRDLRKASDPELLPLINLLSPTEKRPSWAPWYVWPLSQSPHGYLVFEGMNWPLLVPSESMARVTWFAPSGTPVKVWPFQTGWRLFPTSASITYDSTVSMYLISITTKRVINGRDMSRIVLGFNGDLDAVRLEDSTGKVISNRYYAPNLLVGPMPRYKTVADLKFDINSKVPLQVLRGLLFVAGEHRDPLEPPLPNSPPVIQEDDTLTSVNQKIRSDKEVAYVLQGLVRSSGLWIRELAERALLRLNGPYKDK